MCPQLPRVTNTDNGAVRRGCNKGQPLPSTAGTVGIDQLGNVNDEKGLLLFKCVVVSIFFYNSVLMRRCSRRPFRTRHVGGNPRVRRSTLFKNFTAAVAEDSERGEGSTALCERWLRGDIHGLARISCSRRARASTSESGGLGSTMKATAVLLECLRIIAFSTSGGTVYPARIRFAICCAPASLPTGVAALSPTPPRSLIPPTIPLPLSLPAKGDSHIVSGITQVRALMRTSSRSCTCACVVCIEKQRRRIKIKNTHRNI